MTYEELLISIDLKGYENVLPSVGKKCFNSNNSKHWFIICDDGDCHLFDENGIEDDIKKVTTIYEDMIPKNIKKIVIPNSVTNLGPEVFNGCYKLSTVTIPNNITIIRDGEFCYCSKLESVTISNSVTSIGQFAFYDCNRLTSITIPNSITNIGRRTFEDCNGLTSITIDKPIEQVKAMKNYPWGIKDESIIKCN